MEKCSMCQQRTQAGKLVAKSSWSMPIVDGSIKTACQQACPTNAIVFGDMLMMRLQQKSTHGRADERNYFLLEEVGVKPNCQLT
jgi:Fe-S-cluster-containing dehydrogenase component